MTNRRDFLKLLGVAAGTGLAGFPYIAAAAELLPKTGRRVVVVGAGFGGATAAKYVRLADPGVEVVLIERSKKYYACPFSNLVIGGSHNMEDNLVVYDRLGANHGVKLVQGEVTAVDAGAKKVVLANGTLTYDRLILAPGIDFRFDEIDGYKPEQTPGVIPHAWKAGEQTLLLKGQLEKVPDGGVVVVSIPLTPFRCPPGPYERVSQMAWALKRAGKNKAKILVLDANADIASKAALFRKGWEKHYKGMIDYRPNNKVVKVITEKRAVDTGVEEIRGDLVNLIPPQKAGAIAHQAGVVGDGRWCPVDPVTFESTKVPGIHVIGDACIADPMPKSGFSANSQAKACAANVVALLNGKPPVEAAHVNACYSFVTDREAISVTAVYKVQGGKLGAVANAGGVSPDLSELEGTYARGWIKNILADIST